MRVLAIVASVAAALGAGAVASSAQSGRPAEPAVADCAGALPAPAEGAPATVVKFDGITGESAVEQFRIGAATPGGHRPLVLSKPIDRASPQLLSRLVSGTHIPKLTLSQLRLKYTLTDVTVVDVDHTSGRDRVCVTYADGELEYTPANPNGSPGAPIRALF